MKTVTLSRLNAFKHAQEPFSCLTAYDASFAQHADAAGIDVHIIAHSIIHWSVGGDLDTGGWLATVNGAPASGEDADIRPARHDSR